MASNGISVIISGKSNGYEEEEASRFYWHGKASSGNGGALFFHNISSTIAGASCYAAMSDKSAVGGSSERVMVNGRSISTIAIFGTGDQLSATLSTLACKSRPALCREARALRSKYCNGLSL